MGGLTRRRLLQLASIGGLGTLSGCASGGEETEVPATDSTPRVTPTSTLTPTSTERSTSTESPTATEDSSITISTETPAREYTTESQKLVPEDGEPMDRFGTSVSLSGGLAAIGAWDNGGEDGTVYVYRSANEGWLKQASLRSESSEDELFGVSVSLNGERMIVGAAGARANGPYSGAADVLRKEPDGWQREARIAPENGFAEQLFGIEVKMASRSAFVYGARKDGERYVGCVYVFELIDGEWRQRNRFDVGGYDSGLIRYSMAVTEKRAVLSPVEPIGEGGQGVQVLKRRNGEWQREATLSPETTADGARGRSSVAMGGDSILVSIPVQNGRSTVYEYRRQNGEWRQTETIESEISWFGATLGAHAETLVVGCTDSHPNGGLEAGSAYVYTKSDDGWAERALIAPAPEGHELLANDYFASSIAVSADWVLVGSFGDADPNGDNAGSAYVFDIS